MAVDEDVTAANERGEPAWLELALTEYRALRDEILTTMETQQGTLRFGTATLSILVVGTLNVWDEKLVAALAFPYLRFPRWFEKEIALAPRTLLAGAAALLAVCIAGYWLVMLDYDLSRDQSMATLAAEITPAPFRIRCSRSA